MISDRNKEIRRSPSENEDSKESKVKPQTKMEAFLVAIYEAGERGINQPEANKLYGESCLHSSISWATNHWGLVIDRQLEPYRTRVGSTTHFMRYALLDPDSRKRALDRIMKYKSVRGAMPIPTEIPSTYRYIGNRAPQLKSGKCEKKCFTEALLTNKEE